MAKPLPYFERVIGDWTSEATHPKMPGVTVRGSATFEWLEGDQFVIMRSRNEHPDFPDSIAIIGYADRDRADGEHGDAMTMSYFDSRGVSRIYQFSIDDKALRYWREAPGFSQRLTGTFTDNDTIVGESELREDDVHWTADLQITYHRAR